MQVPIEKVDLIFVGTHSHGADTLSYLSNVFMLKKTT